ncbi:hypothetical protein HPT29_001330 [Microvirga terrae]|uniref:Asparagine synthetase domain-containing protein n=1 Tax=Microvirga terrae TaxID=2740529 RepID=A0ABY5RRF4_9HYPH|nr:hypothetical protein [Microvirga terrae]UVF19826.1 hypothetical protein HPT29_001330 [Microvirga terrae]
MVRGRLRCFKLQPMQDLKVVPHHFLISSLDPMPQHYLHGTCWQDEDLILADGGYARYRAVRNATIQAGQDGAYIVANSTERETVIGTDFSGYHKLFLYQHADHWILSNSLIETARFAAAKGLPVTIDESHLASFFIKGAFGNQLTSLRTSVKEIRLVPATMEVVVPRVSLKSNPTLRLTPATRMAQGETRYGAALREYLRLWVGRMATVLQSDLSMSSELTGGQDSRAVLALMLAAARLVGVDSIRRINFTSNEGQTNDFAVAREIAERFHLRFMTWSDDRRSPPLLGLVEAYEKWKSLCLGVYAPSYFPRRRPVPTSIVFGGSGGEGHRRFYPDIGLDRFLALHRNHIPSAAHFRTLKNAIAEDLAFLQQGPEVSVDPLVLHYRHFRDRCHGGRTPQYTNLLSPLSSASLRRTSSLCTPDQLDRRQVVADILINASRELASMPFDTPKKSFVASHFDEVIDASDAIGSARTSGRVFAAASEHAASGDFTKQKALHLLRDDFLSHYDTMGRTGFFPRSYLEEAKAVVEEAARKGRFSHPVEGCSVSHVILAGELSGLAREDIRRPSTLEAFRSAILRRLPGRI